MKYICPVCGYEGLSEKPYDDFGCASYEICHCCGFEFGFDDDSNNYSYADYKETWLSNGANWYNLKYKPKNWNVVSQLKNLEKLDNN